MDHGDTIYVAGHRGLVGAAITRLLASRGFDNLVLKTRDALDLTNQSDVDQFFSTQRPRFVFLAAARVGGILANDRYRGQFIYQNLMIQTNVLEAARRYGVKRLLFLGSSCIYPRDCPQPMRESHLLTGPLEETNRAYAIAKIAGVEMCRAYNQEFGTSYVPIMPTNLYGIHDNFDPETSHVLPALLRKVHEAKVSGERTVTVWGSGTPLREFLHVDDLASACLHIMQASDHTELVNVGTGKEISIRSLAELICEIVGFDGTLVFDSSKPDGTPRKRLDVSKLSALGWSPKISLKEGIQGVYDWYRESGPGSHPQHASNANG